MSAPEQDRPRWSVVHGQCLADGAEVVGMITTPAFADEIAQLLNAQEAGAVAAEARCAQRIEDLQREVSRQFHALERRAERAEAQLRAKNGGAE